MKSIACQPGERIVPVAPSHRELKVGVALVALVAALRGLGVAVLVPPMHGPDEPAHFDYTQRLAEMSALPRLAPSDSLSQEMKALVTQVMATIGFHPERHLPPASTLRLPLASDRSARQTSGWSLSAPYPPVYYASAAAFYIAARDRPLLQRLFAVRLASVAWSVLGTIAAFLAGAWWAGRVRDGVLVATLALAHPMLTLASGTVTNDAALFAAAAVAFAALAIARHPAHRRSALTILAVSSLTGVLCKPTFVLLLPVLGSAAVLVLDPRQRRSWWLALVALAPAAAAALAWSAHTSGSMAALFPPREAPLSMSAFLKTWVLDPERILYLWGVTFWMCWGWLDTRLPTQSYWAIWTGLALAAGGLVIGWRRLQAQERRLCVFGLAATAWFLLCLYAIEVRVLRAGTTFIQGRYLLPLFPLQFAGIATALRALSRRLQTRLDAAWLFAAMLVVVSGSTILRVLVRYYS